MSRSTTRRPLPLFASIAGFVALSLVLTVFVVISVLDLSTRSGREFSALMPDAAGLRSGDNVAIAGLDVGKVLDVELAANEQVKVTFTLTEGNEMFSGTRTAVRYADLIGTRYLALLPPEEGTAAGTRLAAGTTVPAAQNVPTVDLTAVFDGFQPLFDILDPEEVNQLSGSIVEIFQGQSGTVASLVEQIGDITTELAGRREVVSEVITNLSSLLTSVNEQDDALGDVIDGFASVENNLAAQRESIAGAIDGLSIFTSEADRLTKEVAPAVDDGIKGLSAASEALNDNADTINRLIDAAPGTVRALNRVVDSGSFIKVYLCNLDLRVSGRLNVSLVPGVEAPKAPVDLQLPSGEVGGSAPNGVICR